MRGLGRASRVERWGVGLGFGFQSSGPGLVEESSGYLGQSDLKNQAQVREYTVVMLLMESFLSICSLPLALVYLLGP